MLKEQIKLPEFDFLSDSEKEFVTGFDEAVKKIGYESDGIKPYVCFGRYKIEYTRAGNKTKKYVARFYFRDSGIVLRLYFTNIDKHRKYIENAQNYIKAPFVNDTGKCRHCDENGGGIGNREKCSFRKSYTIDNVLYEKCSGETFYFENYNIDAVPKYIELLKVFYPARKDGK